MSQLTQTQTVVRPGTRVPPGHIIVSDKWRGTEIVTALQASVNVVLEGRLGVVDFHPSSDTGVVYVSEGDLVADAAYRRKLVKLRKVNTIRGIVIAEKTAMSQQYYPALQKFVVLELGLVLLPVTTASEAAGLLTQMVNVENKPGTNTFRVKRKQPSKDAGLLAAVQLIPSLGGVKAKALLMKFHSLQGICDASEEELAMVIGKASAVNVKAFFRQRTDKAS